MPITYCSEWTTAFGKIIKIKKISVWDSATGYSSSRDKNWFKSVKRYIIIKGFKK